jgi:uncharacterized membrane protein YcaP (DUF421 family)
MEAVLRVAFVYILLLAAFRVMGKRELGQLSPFELVVLILIPEIFSDALVGGDHSMTAATIGGSTLLALVFLTSVLSHRFRGFQRLVEGQPTVLVHDGRFCEREMNRTRVQPDEVFAHLRAAGLERLSQVRWAILEEDGKISVVPRDPDEGVDQSRDEDIHA